MWDGKIGPSFIVVVGLAALTGLQWLFDGKSEVNGRVIRLETQMLQLVRSVERVENKIDVLPAFHGQAAPGSTHGG